MKLSKKWQILITFIIASVALGGYFWDSALPSLETPLIEILGINTLMYGIFYSVYSIPNIVLVLLAGIFIDYFGNHIALVLFSSVQFLGSFMMVFFFQILGYQKPKVAYYLMLIGMFFFGAGNESVNIVKRSACAEWIDRKYLSVATAIITSTSRLGSIVSFLTTGQVYKATNIIIALWYALIILSLSFIASFTFFLINYIRYKRRIKRKHVIFKEIILSIRKFSVKYWIIIMIMIFGYLPIYGFKSFSNAILIGKWNYSLMDADTLLAVIDMMAIPGTIFIGWLMDYTRMPAWIMMIGSVYAPVGYLILAFTYSPPIWGILLIGVQWSILSAVIWPTISTLVDLKYHGIAYALASSIFNLMLTIMDIIFGYVANIYWLLYTLFTIFSGTTIILSLINLLV
jgi:MFS family permease